MRLHTYHLLAVLKEREIGIAAGTMYWRRILLSLGYLNLSDGCNSLALSVLHPECLLNQQSCLVRQVKRAVWYG